MPEAKETEEPPFEPADDLFQGLPAGRAIVTRVGAAFAQYDRVPPRSATIRPNVDRLRCVLSFPSVP
jgi:hypothetical protein